MLWFKSKLDSSLKHGLKNNYYKKYRVLIYCNNFKNNIEKKILSYRGTVLHSLDNISIICAYLSSSAIARLIEFPEVKWITRDTFCFLCANSVESSNRVRLSEKYSLTGKGIGIALIDTGVYPHYDLINPYNRIKYFKDFINDYKYPYDDHGHGTFIGGILCGNGGLSKGVYKGMAPGAYLYCYKAFNSQGKAFASDILAAIDSIINQCRDYNIRVLCMPIESYNNDFFVTECFSKLLDKAVENNIIPVVPSGSNPSLEGSIEGIACLTNCITVGGLDTTRSIEKYDFSSCGPFNKTLKPDLSAACVDVYSLNTNKRYISERNGMKIYPPALEEAYCSYSGTSAAAAYISGICTLVLENNPNLSVKDVKALLKASCRNIELPRWQQGEGMVDVSKIIK